MKTLKSYTCRISGNKQKLEFLENTLQQIQQLSEFVFYLCKSSWNDQKSLYRLCRQQFPQINSKCLQNFISLYAPWNYKKAPKKPIKASIFMDQGQQVSNTTKPTKYAKIWLKLFRKYFPLFGKHLDLSKGKVKLVQIYKRSSNNKLYLRLSIEIEKPDPQPKQIPKVVGLDVNYKRVVLSNNIFKHIKQLAHRKLERKKNNQKLRNLANYSKDYLHKLTSQISKELLQQGVDVLVLEDLRHLRRSASRKLGTSKGKMLNYIINSFPYSMFQNFLEYKCLDQGILVVKINPAYTSKTCSSCGSRNTSRPQQERFVCNDCLIQLDTDLNGSRNIEKFYKKSQCATSDSSALLDPTKVTGIWGL